MAVEESNGTSVRSAIAWLVGESWLWWEIRGMFRKFLCLKI